jgi:DNA-directed RNA polymerase subunit RPC12/RpoP
MLQNTPFELKFTTEALSIVQELTITGPLNDVDFKVTETITVTGTSKNVPVDTQLTVTLGETFQKTMVGADGTWSVEITAPTEPGQYQIMVSFNDINHSISINIKDTDTPIDDQDDDGETGLFGMGQIFDWLIILILFIIILIIILIVIRKKKSGEEGEETVETKEVEEADSQEFECPDCGTVAGEDEDVCSGCGTEFEDEEFECPDCGTIVEGSVESCPECGVEFVEKVDEEEEGDAGNEDVGNAEPTELYEHDTDSPAPKILEELSEDISEVNQSKDGEGGYECPDCGTTLGLDDNVCSECGAEFETEDDKPEIAGVDADLES